MAITVRTSPANQSGNASSVAFSRDASVVVGDLRIVFIFTSSGATMPSPPSGWSVLLDTNVAPDTSRRLYVISRVYASGDASSTTITFSSATNYGLGQVALGGALSTLHAGPTRDTGDDGTGANQTAPTQNATVANTVLVCFYGQAAGGSASAVITTPSGMTSLGNSVGNGSQGSSTRLAYENRAATGATGSRTATSPSTGKWAGISLLVAPAFTPISTSDSGTGSDQATLLQVRGYTDSGVGSDARTILADLATLTDSGTGFETVAIQQLTDRATSDSATGSDQVVVVPYLDRPISDSGAGSDQVGVQRTNYVSPTDSGTGSDQATLLQIRGYTDSGVGSDQVTSVVGVHHLNDSGVVTETISIVDIPFTPVLPLRIGTNYDLVVVARIPATGQPTFIEIDPVEWKGLSYTNTLSKPQELQASCLVSSLTEPVLQRLRRLHDLATELWLYRRGQIVFAGPLLGFQVTGETLTLRALGILAYLRMMVIQQDMKFVQVDQFQMVKQMVDQWQNLEYGHFGIDTSGVGLSGQTRDGTYLRNELHNVGQRVEELGDRRDGFDVEVDPATRKLQLWYPQKGIDRSTGMDAIVIDARNITSGDIMCSVAQGDLASEAYGTSKTNGSDTTLYSAQSNIELRTRYGRTAVTSTYQDISVQGTLDAYMQGMLDARDQALLVPGPKVRVTPDADLDDYAEGDTVLYEFGDLLTIGGGFRIRKQTINVEPTGQESVTLEFV